MKKFLKYRGYYGEICYSDEDECFVGHVVGILSMIAVHEDTLLATAKELIDSIDEYLESCEEDGTKPNETNLSVAREIEVYFNNEDEGSIRGFRFENLAHAT